MRYACVAVLVLMLVATTAVAEPTVWYVHPDSTLNTIQAALDSCADNDIVLVAPGTYYENIAWPGVQGVQLLSVLGPDTTIIDGGGTASVIQISNVDTTTVIRGFTITNGSASMGGGMLVTTNASPTISANIFTGSNATLGGGAMCITTSSSPLVYGNTIDGNHSGFYAGGILALSATCAPYFRDNVIVNNTADSLGGGICFATCPATFIDNEVSGNAAKWGGGICFSNLYGCTATVDSSIITGNIASSTGGGIYCTGSSPYIRYCTITGNTSLYGGGDYGSGMRIYGYAPRVRHCIISDNVGSGVGLGSECSPMFDSCEVAANSRYGFHASTSTAEIHYCEIFDNELFGILKTDPSDTIDATYNWWGDPSGPGGVGPGTGDEVSFYVLYDPWLTAPVGVGEEKPVVRATPPGLVCEPNPFSREVAIRLKGIPQHRGTGATEIRIYDISGRLVRQISLPPLDASPGATWDGKDSQGQPVTQGVYFVRCSEGSRSLVEKVIRMK